MQIGFETTAAVPKRLRAVEEQPVHESMRGDRRITQAPSTDQKKVRRAMQRKTADMRGPAGECRLCGGDLKVNAVDHTEGTVHAECRDCGAEHQLQRPSTQRSAALRYEAFQNLSEAEQERLRYLASLQFEAWMPPQYRDRLKPCASCGAKPSHQTYQGQWGQSGGGKAKKGITTECTKCGATNHVAASGSDDYDDGSRKKTRPDQYAVTGSLGTAAVLALVGSTWVPVVNTAPYLSTTASSAIARRAQAVLALQEEIQ